MTEEQLAAEREDVSAAQSLMSRQWPVCSVCVCLTSKREQRAIWSTSALLCHSQQRSSEWIIWNHEENRESHALLFYYYFFKVGALNLRYQSYIAPVCPYVELQPTGDILHSFVSNGAKEGSGIDYDIPGDKMKTKYK